MKAISSISIDTDLAEFAKKENINLSHVVNSELKKLQEHKEDQGKYAELYKIEQEKRQSFQIELLSMRDFLISRKLLDEYNESKNAAIKKEAEEESKDILGAKVTTKEVEAKVEFKKDEELPTETEDNKEEEPMEEPEK